MVSWPFNLCSVPKVKIGMTFHVFDSSVNGHRSAVQARNLGGRMGGCPKIFSPRLVKCVGGSLKLLDTEKIWAISENSSFLVTGLVLSHHLNDLSQAMCLTTNRGILKDINKNIDFRINISTVSLIVSETKPALM